jgi:cytochrome c
VWHFPGPSSQDCGIFSKFEGWKQTAQTAFMKKILFAFVIVLSPFFLLSQPTVPKGKPGFSQPLTSLHPTLRAQSLQTSNFKPRVGGMTLLPDGSLVVCTWSTAGSVYRLPKPGEDTLVQRIAAGLAEPMGLAHWEGELYVAQRQELSRLGDSDQDGNINTYETVSDFWTTGTFFQDLAFGLPVLDGKLMVGLSLWIEANGQALEKQSEDRGKVWAISPDGSHEVFASGLNTPSGLAAGPDNTLLIVDNLGAELDASRLLVSKGGTDFGYSVDGWTFSSPQAHVWLPKGTVCARPSQPLFLRQGPFAGQLLLGDAFAGGMRRISLQKVGEEYQGCLYRFSQGFEAGVNRLLEGPDGKIYAGGLDGIGNWGFPQSKRNGLDLLTWQDTDAFDLYSVEARAKGLLIRFTQALAEGEGTNPSHYQLSQWHYLPSGKASPASKLLIEGTSLSADRKELFLAIPEMKEGNVLYLKLANPPLSEAGQILWSNEAWFTLNNVPDEEGPAITQNVVKANQLTAAEEAAGWRSLFAGDSLDQWRTFQQEAVSSNWEVLDGEIFCNGGENGDLITREQFENFELQLEWKISPGGNSGLFFHVQEEGFEQAWHAGPEFQLLDDSQYPDANPKNITGANYDLEAPAFAMARPAGEYNHLRLVVNQGKVTHWLNGAKLLEYEIGSTIWRTQLDASKFIKMPGYGVQGKGHIGLQDHGHQIWFRNLKIREL